MTQDLSNYTVDYYRREQIFSRYEILRPDQLAALCYTLDWPYWGFEVQDGHWRDPGVILSIGAGRGELEQTLETIGHYVVGVDPSPGAWELYRGSRLQKEASADLVASADTVIFCESLEHIPWAQTEQILANVTPGTRLIFVNFIDQFPIVPDPVGDGWDHITRVDDALYDRLSVGRRVVLRKASHLVLDF